MSTSSDSSIRSDIASPEIKALNYHTASLLKAMSRVDLAEFSWTLYSKGMIQASDVEKTNLSNITRADKSNALLDAIRDCINADVGLFQEFVVSLKDKGIEIAGELEFTRSKLSTVQY